MSHLREKSNFNRDAAESLISLSLYAPSVHCSYYSCFQFLKYCFKLNSGFTYEEINDRVRKNRKSEHTYIYDSVVTILSGMGRSNDEYRYVKTKYNDLKQFRTEADYYDKEVNEEISEKALSISREIVRIVKKNLL